MGSISASPIPLLTFPLKGEESLLWRCCLRRPRALRLSLQREFFQRITRDAIDGPVVQGDRCHRFVESNRGFIPVERGPFEATAAPFVRDARDVQEQRPPIAFAPMLGPYENILQPQSTLAEKCREVMKEDGEADCNLALEGQERFCTRPRSKQCFLQGCFCRGNEMRQALVFSESMNQIEQRGGVVDQGRSDGNHCVIRK